MTNRTPDKTTRKAQRKRLPETTRLKVWVRCGGRCVICNRYLLDDGVLGLEVTIGQLAHIVGQSSDVRSPRSQHPLPLDERDDPDNLVLICPTEHLPIDRPELTGIVDRDVLVRIKHEHEARIEHLTGLGHDRRTVVIRLVGNLRSAAVDVSREAVATATLKSASRFPTYELGGQRQGVEVDLRALPGEEQADAAYYEAGMRRIDEVLSRELHPVIEQNRIDAHLSVFAFGRLPLLVYLGSRLDDTVRADIYERHRDGSWNWRTTGRKLKFTTENPRVGTRTDAVTVVLNLTGTIGLGELPDITDDTTTYVVAPVGIDGSNGLFRRREDLEAFELEFRALLGRIERERKNAVIHLFAAAPVSAAVTIGRCHAQGVHAPLVTYDRVAGVGYQEALQLH